ncbi:uncharacterized protein BX663DRAFT_559548 [Cokeromyces recurvatus]|uniref:uncharacterized protein n=1 Tax=Cokeromyces recurvatus TaxID=90255 RepID=UPI00221EEBD8|nr:uncharacterized protein BX663DRAFT_559548 [Cokeromyces recurvatus]KAI7904527.1 hypothetical protein BX663DRAFT_559548 [Cokeromyces recurvatus]
MFYQSKKFGFKYNNMKMKVSLPNEVLIDIFKFLSEYERIVARKSLKLTCKLWYNTIVSLYGEGIHVCLDNKTLYRFYDDLQMNPTIGYKVEELHYMSKGHDMRKLENFPQHFVFQSIIKACPYLVELSFHVSTVYSHLKAIRYRTLKTHSSIQRLHVHNLQSYSLSTNRLYIDLCMTLKESLTLFEILSLTTFEAVVKYYKSIYHFIEGLRSLRHLKIGFDNHSQTYTMVYPRMKLDYLLEENKGLRRIELEGFKLIQCSSDRLLLNRYSSITMLTIRAWTLEFAVLQFIMSRLKQLNYLSLYAFNIIKVNKDHDKFIKQFTYYLEKIKTVHVHFKIDGVYLLQNTD